MTIPKINEILCEIFNDNLIIVMKLMEVLQEFVNF